MRIVIAAIHKWNILNANKFILKYPEYDIKLITEKDELTLDFLESFKPDWIMFAHWSWILPESIYGNYKCVVYHISDVPNARGGSPVQNQIERGITETKISAIAVDGGLDTGKVYLKRSLSLEGSAEEIFIRSSNIVFNEMIPYILENNPIPQEQEPGGYVFKRRKPADSALPLSGDLKKVFDHIRMLDAEGYPTAYLEWGDYLIKFDRAKLCVDHIEADVKIVLKNKD